METDSSIPAKIIPGTEEPRELQFMGSERVGHDWARIHAHKGFSVVQDVDVFLESPCFFYDQMDAGNLISGSSALYNPALHLELFGSCIAEA